MSDHLDERNRVKLLTRLHKGSPPSAPAPRRHPLRSLILLLICTFVLLSTWIWLFREFSLPPQPKTPTSAGHVAH